MLSFFAHAGEHTNENMMKNMQSHEICMMNGSWIMALTAALVLTLLVILIVLGIMGIIVLYRKNFANKKQ